MRLSGVRASSRRLGALTAFTGVILAGCLLGGCASGAAPAGAGHIDVVPAPGVPFARVAAGGSDFPPVPGGLSPDEAAAVGVLADLQTFAAGVGAGPGVLSGGYVAVDAGGATGAACVRQTADLLGTAFYCPEQDAIVADSAALVPVLRGHYGDGALAVTLAHEYGHAVQADGGWTGPGDPPLLVELQADCFAGAFLHWSTDAAAHVQIPAESRVRAVAALLDFRDVPTTDPAAVDAHGSATDRLRALDAGLRLGAGSCPSMTADQVLDATTLGLPAPGRHAEAMPADAMRDVLAEAGLTQPAVGAPAPGDPPDSEPAPAARDAAAALALADAATGGDTAKASCLLGAWAGAPSRRGAADQALDHLRTRPDATYDQLQGFSAGMDGGASACG